VIAPGIHDVLNFFYLNPLHPHQHNTSGAAHPGGAVPPLRPHTGSCGDPVLVSPGVLVPVGLIQDICLKNHAYYPLEIKVNPLFLTPWERRELSQEYATPAE